jgi:ATP-dependent Clp protease ATP-binding subunit ClpB
MNNFDKVVTGALDLAQAEALNRSNTELAPVHLLYGLIKNPASYSSKALKEYENSIVGMLEQVPKTTSQLDVSNIRPSGALSNWLTLAGANATETGKQEIAEKHLLKYLPQIFPNLPIDFSKFNQDEEEVEVPTFLVNLNELAEEGKLDPVIGRTKEIRAVMEILGRRGKNNPVLVGPAGVGKTAIVEGLANEIVKGQVPDLLKGKTVYTMELGSLIAGTKFRGEFEERIQNLLKFAKNGAGQYIIFIDEIHQLVGAGKTDGAMDAANLLKPALARGELHCIGATTDDEFQKYILNDPALERRFRKVPVLEPTKEDSIEILMGLKDKFEGHHGIKISDDAIYSAVMLSDQYITDKNLPDKAIDLIDESSAALKLSAEAMPASLVELQSEIRNKRILAQVEKNNKDVVKEINVLQKSFDEAYLNWEKEVSSLKRVSEVKSRLERLKFDLEKAEREQNYEEASKIKYSLLPEVEKELEAQSHEWILGQKHVAGVISRHTGIPVEKILKSKQESLLNLETVLNQRVYGQQEALHEISETLLTSYAGLSDETRPLGSFLLLGPTGVGKTETAKALTQYLFDNEENIIRIDLSEFSEKHSVAKLIGAPAGYVGYDDGGVLTEAVRRRPYSVILFDEVEKAHPDFADILLQILDDGRLTDNKGRVINFKNTVIMLTSNSKNPDMDFKPEVLGRLDSILNFNKLDKSVMSELVMKQISQLNQRLKSKNVNVEFDQQAIEHLADAGFDPDFGARPLQSTFQRLVVRPLSKKILANELSEGTHNVSVKNNTLIV